jgi:hypothetical protein
VAAGLQCPGPQGGEGSEQEAEVPVLTELYQEWESQEQGVLGVGPAAVPEDTVRET